MKKLIIIALSLSLFACGGNGSQNNIKKSTQQVADDGHNHAPGEVCPSEAKKKVADDGHNHAPGEVCPSEAKAAAKTQTEHNHAADEICTESEGHPNPEFVETELKESQAKEAKIKVYTVAPTQISAVIKTSGKISSNQTDKKVIVAPTSGVVTLIAPIIDGAAVEKGKKLMVISSANIEGGDVVKKAQSRYEAAAIDFETANELIKDKLISKSDYNAAKVNYDSAKAEFDAVKGSSSAVVSPIKGFVNELLVNEGQYVNAGEPLAIVAANNKATLTAYVSERYWNRLKNITSANFKTTYNDNVFDINEMGGRFVAYGKGENDNSLLIPVTFEFSNKGDIALGSQVEVYLKERTNKEALIVPLSAITEEQNVYYVYTHRGGLLFRKHEVKLGVSDGRFVEIIAGVEAGDKVVSSGTYQIKLASSSGAIPAACGHAH